MHMSYLILRMRCNVEVDPSCHQSKFTTFNKHTFGRMQYVKDAQGNYVKKFGKEPEQPKPKELTHKVPEPPAQDPPPLPTTPPNM